MPPKKGKNVAQQTSQAAPAASVPIEGTLTSEQITAALIQLFESQRQTQQQIDALVAYQNRAQPADHLAEKINSGRIWRHTQAGLT